MHGGAAGSLIAEEKGKDKADATNPHPAPPPRSLPELRVRLDWRPCHRTFHIISLPTTPRISVHSLAIASICQLLPASTMATLPLAPPPRRRQALLTSARPRPHRHHPGHPITAGARPRPHPVAAHPSPPEHIGVDTPSPANKKPARANRARRAEHVAADTPSGAKKKKPVARRGAGAEHVAIDIPADANNKEEPAAVRPSSRLVRALVAGVSLASLVLGAPAMFVTAMVTHRLSPFTQLVLIFLLMFIFGLFFLLREPEKDKQLQEQAMDRN